ncbi:MAG: hypothetical protein K6T55_12105 [Syntrophobacterales bacterium]|nr:hypothetical protein [Syntrophobacterales bacterium]
MGKVYDKKRRNAIRRKQERRAKLQKLRVLYHATRDESQRARIVDKMSRIAPFLSIQAYLAEK